jgi:putative oxidoreductase
LSAAIGWHCVRAKERSAHVVVERVYAVACGVTRMCFEPRAIKGGCMEQLCELVGKYAPLAARILLAQVFIISGVGKIARFAGTAALMAGVGFPAAKVLLALVIALEVGGGLLLIIGWQVRWVALAFCTFTLLATMVFHAFWNSDPASVLNQLNNFMKNFAIIGGMLYVVAYGAGPFSIDRLRGDANRGGKTQ